jgi:MFS family permease
MIRGMFARYLAFLRLPDVARVLAFTFIARLPMGMVTLSLLMHVRALTGSFSVAGTAVGCYMAASALTAPFVGRWIDRAGPRIPLLVTGVCSPAAMLVIFFARNFNLAPGGLYLVALLAGCFAPPITVLVRTILRQRFEGDKERKLAFTVDAIMVEGVFTLGPLLTAAVLTVGSPRTAFGVATGFAALAVPMFMASHATRYFRGEEDAQRSLLGPLTEPSLLAVYATTFLLTMTFGCMEVGYPAFGATHAWAALGAMLIALNSVGSGIGGFIYGGLHVVTASGRLLPRLLLAMVLPLALHAVTTSVLAYAVLAVIAGLLVAPALTMVMLLISERAPARYAAEAFTWSATCIVSGFALGAAAAGRIVDAYSPQMAFAAAACTIAAAALVSVVTRPRNPLNLPAPT